MVDVAIDDITVDDFLFFYYESSVEIVVDLFWFLSEGFTVLGDWGHSQFCEFMSVLLY